MKTRLSVIFLLFVMATMSLSCASPKKNAHFEFATSQSKPGHNIASGRLGILPFQSVVPSIGVAVSDIIAANLLDSPFTIVERTQLSRILQEHQLSVSGITADADYARIGQLSNIDYLLVGHVAVRSPRWQRITGATARVIDVTNGELLITATYTPPKRGWAAPIYMAESLAAAIKREAAKP